MALYVKTRLSARNLPLSLTVLVSPLPALYMGPFE